MPNTLPAPGHGMITTHAGILRIIVCTIEYSWVNGDVALATTELGINCQSVIYPGVVAAYGVRSSAISRMFVLGLVGNAQSVGRLPIQAIPSTKRMVYWLRGNQVTGAVHISMAC